jgi:outer membrane murein-binding lipoprotein Lpp
MRWRSAFSKLGIPFVVTVVLIAVVAGTVYLSGRSSTSNKELTVSSDLINSSLSCNSAALENSTNLVSLQQNIQNYSKFMSLEQNLNFSFSGLSCLSALYKGQFCGKYFAMDNTTQLCVDFQHSDTAHPFTECDGSSTAYPTYDIEALIYLTPSGYDLTRTTYSALYYDEQNTTIYCTTQTST